MENKSVITNANADSGSASSHNELEDFQPESGNPPVVSAPSQQNSSKQALLTQNVVGTREVTTSDKRVFVLVTTDKGSEIWVPKSQWNPEAETVSFSVIKKGQVWFTDSSGNNVIATRDINQFKACGKANSKETKLAILTALYSAGFNPSINL